MNDLSLVSGPFMDDLFPFCLIRSAADIRCGLFTIREKWTDYYRRYPLLSQIPIPANILPRKELVDSLLQNGDSAFANWPLKINQCLDILRFNGEEIRHDFEQIRSRSRSEPLSATNKITGTDIFIEKGAVVEHCFLNAELGPI